MEKKILTSDEPAKEPRNPALGDATQKPLQASSDVRAQILVIDDQPLTRITLEGLFAKEPYDLHFAESGVQGLALFTLLHPDVILLDATMAHMNGFEICQVIRSTYTLSEVPILFITAQDDRPSKLAGLKAGVDDFVNKPFDGIELLTRVRSMIRLNRYRLIAEQHRTLEDVSSRLLDAYDKTIEEWSTSLDLRDRETEGHSQRVTEKTIVLAQAYGLGDEELKNIRRGALLHDVGKLGIPDTILLKPGKLTEEEWEVMKQHPVLAYEWLSKIDYMKPSLDIPYCHHEKWDGSGYPRGLKGEEIPIAARLFAIIDVWDAITSERPYRKAMPRNEAYQYILSESGKHFDPEVVVLFASYIEEFEHLT